MNKYSVLKKQSYSLDEYSLVPIRFEDRFNIMKWRNEQMYHLRQTEKLTTENQNNYFNNVISKLFTNPKPNQILFSFLKNNICIGYGGLVHMNWIDRNAEISFIMNTELESNEFELIWNKYLALIEKIAFIDLKLHKISTYAYNIRPKIYTIFENNNFIREAVLNEQCFFNGKYIDVIIHSKIHEG